MMRAVYYLRRERARLGKEPESGNNFTDSLEELPKAYSVLQMLEYFRDKDRMESSQLV